MLRKIIYAAVICLAAVACVKEEGDTGDNGADKMIEKEVLGLYVNGKDVLVYDRTLHQYAFNTKRNTFRIQNSAQNRLFVCEMSETPSVGKEVEVVITTKGISNFKDASIEMEVLKETDGRVWLYDSESKTGLVVMH